MKSSLSHTLSRAGLVASLLAATLSVGALATGAYAATPVRVVPGQLIVKVPATMGRQDVDALAERAGCVVVRPLAYNDTYYLFRLKSAVGRSTPVRPTGAGPVSRAADDVARNAVPITEDIREAIRKVRETPGVLAGPDIVLKFHQAVGVTPNDPYYASNGLQRWHMDMIQMPQAWAVQAGTRQAKAVVADSGVDVNHPDLQIAQSQNFATANPAEVLDDYGHGTHIAGTVGAVTNNAAGVVGVAGWKRAGVDVQVYNARIGTAAGPITSAAIESYGWARSLSADVINLSFGSDGIDDADIPLFDVHRAAITETLQAGVTVVASAGNSAQNGEDAGNNAFPADFPGVIKVSAIGPNRTLASYSNYGGPVAIGAPGGDGFGPDTIWSTWPTYAVAIDPNARNYFGIQGTSMAAPHVTGVVALLAAAGAPRNPTRMKQIIQETATALDETPNLAGGNKYGAGLLNAYAAVQLAVDTYADPAPSLLGVAVPADRKASYYTTFSQVGAQVTISGVKKFLSPTDPVNQPSVLTIELRTATEPSVVRAVYTYSTAPGGARDFDIAPLQQGETAGSARRTITVPPAGAGQVGLNEGRYNVVATLTYNGVTETSQDSFEVRTRVQPAGRTMFALPFQARLADPSNSERTVLGPSGFTLWRYDATGTLASDPNVVSGAVDASGDYVAFRTTPGSPDNSTVAGFGAGSTGTPLTFLARDPSTSIAPVGVGYWLDLSDNRTLNPIGTTITSEPVAIRLYAARGGGWNMIGAPFDFPVDWAGVLVQTSTNLGARQYTLAEAVSNGVLSGVLVGYDQSQGYVYSVAPFGQLQPFNGYWVQAKQDCVLIVPPNPSQGTGRAAVATPRKATGSLVPSIDGWRVRLSASAAGDVDGQNFLGQAKGASEQEDRLDVPKPPAGAGHAYLRFVSDLADGRKAAYAFDMKPAAGVKQEWTAAVSTDKANTDVTLAWDGLGNLPKRTRLVLTDTVTGRVVPMDRQSAYTFRSGEAGSTRMFKVSLQRAASGGPLQILNLTTSRVADGRGVGGGAGLSLRFTTSQDAEVTGTVRTLSGQVVADLGATTRAVAFKNTSLVWNGRAQNGATVPAGPLLIELRARTAEGEVVTVKRPIQFLR
jgi:subtilisin family serine protease